MSKSKKVFILLVLIFFGIMAYVSYDISSRTTFPGSKPQLKERIQEEILQNDSSKNAETDSIR